MTIERRGVQISEEMAAIPVEIDDHNKPLSEDTTIRVDFPILATSITEDQRGEMRDNFSLAICKTLEDLGIWTDDMDFKKLSIGLTNAITYASEATFAQYPNDLQEIAVEVTRQPDGTPQVTTQVARLIK